MAGFNGQEGAMLLSPEAWGLPIDDGVSMETIHYILPALCSQMTPVSSELCAEFLIDEYMLSSISDNKTRAIILTYLFGEFCKNKPNPVIYLAISDTQRENDVSNIINYNIRKITVFFSTLGMSTAQIYHFCKFLL